MGKELEIGMREIACLLLVLAFCFAAGMTAAQEHPTYQTLWEEASNGPGCGASEYPDLVLVECDAGLTLWYFTRFNHPAHPGVIKRMITQQPDGSWIAQEQGSSFGSVATQPAFKAWLAQLQALDRQMMESIQKQHNTQTPTTAN